MSKPFSEWAGSVPDLERRVLLRSVADAGAREPGCFCSGASHSRLDFFSCVRLYKKINSQVSVQLQATLSSNKRTGGFPATSRDIIFGFKGAGHLLEEPSRFSGKDFGSVLYRAISNLEITGGKVGWDGEPCCKGDEEGGGDKDVKTHLPCRQI